MLGDSASADSLDIIIKLANLERRSGNVEQCLHLYAQYMEKFAAKSDYSPFVALALLKAQTVVARGARDIQGARETYTSCLAKVKEAAKQAAAASTRNETGERLARFVSVKLADRSSLAPP